MWRGAEADGAQPLLGGHVALPLAVLTGLLWPDRLPTPGTGPRPDTAGVERVAARRRPCLSDWASRSVDSSALVREAVRPLRGEPRMPLTQVASD